MKTASCLRIEHDFHPDGRLAHPAWSTAPPIHFSGDWQGAQDYPELATTALALWTPAYFYFAFRCPYTELNLFPQQPPQRTLNLYERDVAEVFLGDCDRISRYKEFEASPNGHWLDLQIDWQLGGPQWGRENGNTVAANIDSAARLWTAEIKIPTACLDKQPASGETWPLNLYRCAGMTEPRAYLAWNPTGTEQPNYHVPERFGRLRFVG
jgi:alpha-galactosidase